MEAADIYRRFLQHPVVCTDSRQLMPGCIFFCLKGANFDGNEFAEQVLKDGAACVVTERQDLPADERIVVAGDVLKTLQDLAKCHRGQLTIPVIGITGTNGKTTTKELIAAVLSKKYRTACTRGNLNNHIGVPLTLLSIKPADEMAVVEMGANHPGEIGQLCELSQPGYGIITNIGKAHIEGFGSAEEIVRTKKALYRAVMRRKGILFVNAGDEILRRNLDYGPVVYYGGNGGILSMTPCLRIHVAGHDIDTHLTGIYNIHNFLCAAAVGHYFGVPDDDIAAALSAYRPSNHRSQIGQIGGNTFISDYYNANPTSMEAALRNLHELEAPRKVAILGDMLELGNISREEHSKIMALCEKFGFETYFVGSEFMALQPARSFPDVAALDDYLENHPVREALVLVKGSNGIHLDKLKILKDGQ